MKRPPTIVAADAPPLDPDTIRGPAGGSRRRAAVVGLPARLRMKPVSSGFQRYFTLAE
jgi:hypothetical protein